MEQLDKILSKSIKRSPKRPCKDLFGNTDISSLQGNQEEIQDIAEWPDEDRLAFERDTTGFYLSGHPLKPFWDGLLRLYGGRAVPIEAMDPSSEPWVGGIVSALSVKTTKKGGKYANLVLEDLLMTYPVLVWPDTFQRYESLIQKGAKLLIRGQIDSQGEGMRKLVAKEVYDLKQKLDEIVHRFGVTVVRLNAEKLTKKAILEVRELLFRTPGTSPVLLALEKGGIKRTLKPAGNLRIDPGLLKSKIENRLDGIVQVFEG